ncbi:Heptaprenyl diphosphate synthase component 2 [Koleobacter methoxysyntrophicus]|jgi:heptaprenyl diphosphate synthase|uniref:Heptaprenyl diphosphate synthase component 2 n=1 Tax=Koleobacter methoxysyntrophicus TaxID=2751313 RepID=A0A8A0RJE1_9FIRM|nr:polyprenyl synthetase family protein [Koleobacter methoxysyntrophicus]QSQ07760.1 Heptaprenyl diphosphate synthase component 2 [Koleobacter methoxysyntrophicus]
MDSFWNEYPEIKEELYRIIRIMKENVRCSQKTIETALLNLIDSGGKLIRPAFVLLSGKFGRYDSEKLCRLGAVIEMIHMATLIHDDIVDDAGLRRGNITIQSKYGKDYAVFMGDFLFARCFNLLSDDICIANIRNVSKVVSRICTGEIEQFSSRYSFNISVKNYLKRIAAKTAALFSLSCYIGGTESGCDETLSKQLAKVGYNIGMAFQIIDDILDYIGDQNTVKKPVGSDLRQGIFTLPLIYALQMDNKELLRIMSEKDYSDDNVLKIIEIVKELNCIGKAKATAKKYTNRAFIHISKLPDNNSKSIFMDIAEKLLKREY